MFHLKTNWFVTEMDSHSNFVFFHGKILGYTTLRILWRMFTLNLLILQVHQVVGGNYHNSQVNFNIMHNKR